MFMFSTEPGQIATKGHFGSKNQLLIHDQNFVFTQRFAVGNSAVLPFSFSWLEFTITTMTTYRVLFGSHLCKNLQNIYFPNIL